MTNPPAPSTTTLFDLSGHTAMVTGAGSGIGQGIALGLARSGVKVALVDRNAPGLDQTRDMIGPDGPPCLTLTADVTSADSLAKAVAQAQTLGPLTLAVNAAGIANANPATEMAEAQFDDLMAINLKGVWLSAQAQARAMIAQGSGGAIVNIASMSGSIVNRGLMQAHYNASKAGVIQLTKSLAMEWVGHGIRVNALSPGYTATPMNTRPEMIHQTRLFEEGTPMGRMANPDEIVGPALFLLSPAASFVTGVDLLVDGGFCCW